MQTSFIALDVETTGLSPAADRVVEVAILRYEDGVEVSSWSSLVNPGIAIPRIAVGIHGITNAKVAQSPSFTEVAAEVSSRLKGLPLLAFNARFDHGFLQMELARAGFNLPPVASWLDSMVAASRQMGRPRVSLKHSCGHFDIEQGKAHRAEDDARAAACLWLHIAGMSNGV